MKRQFIRSTSGWIPVSVLLLLMIALAAGQAEANLSKPSQPGTNGRGPAEVTITLDRRAVRDADTLPLVAEAFLMLTMKIISAGGDEAASHAVTDRISE